SSLELPSWKLTAGSWKLPTSQPLSFLMDPVRKQALLDALSSRIVVLDGAMGSILQARLRVEDYGGAQLENCTDNVSRANPAVVYAVHTSYLEAGADIIETNSFNGHPVSLGEFQ